MIRALALLLLAAPPLQALTLPDQAEVLLDEERPAAAMQVATGPFAAGQVPGPTVTGDLRVRTWRISDAADPTGALMQTLQRQLAAQGFGPVYACAARECGGFDFRFALDIAPEPRMHVDLGDYQYLAARRSDGAAAVLIVSRTASAAYVQLTELAGDGSIPAADAAVPAAAPVTPAAAPAVAPRDATAFAAALENGGALVLDDVTFASGASDLTDPATPSLARIASYLAANPTRTIAIVGHTDASGSLEANIALSRARARAVRTALVDLGADGDRITAEGVGFLAPRATNLTAEGRTQNRRVEVMLTSTR
jgi:outer membrane protein OmpA-like peptidoglycan-associated protein